MARFVTTCTVWHGGLAYLAGQPITLTSEEARPLLASGALEAPAARKPEAEAAQPAPQPELLAPAEQPEPGVLPGAPADPAA